MRTTVTMTEAEVADALREFFLTRRHTGVSGVRFVVRPQYDCRDQPTGSHSVRLEVDIETPSGRPVPAGPEGVPGPPGAPEGEPCEPYVQGSVTYPGSCHPL